MANILSIDGLVLERRNSSASAMELLLSCTNPSISSSTNPSRGKWVKAILQAVLTTKVSFKITYFEPICQVSEENGLIMSSGMTINIHFRLRCCPCPILWGWQTMTMTMTWQWQWQYQLMSGGADEMTTDTDALVFNFIAKITIYTNEHNKVLSQKSKLLSFSTHGLFFLQSFVQQLADVHTNTLTRLKCTKKITNREHYTTELSSPVNKPSGCWFGIKMSSYQYQKTHSGDRTVMISMG